MKNVIHLILFFLGISLSLNAQVTYLDTHVKGRINTNEVLASQVVSYGPVSTLISSPAGSIQTLIVNSDGTYSFIGNTVGTYIYEVPVCFLPMGSDCMAMILKLEVVDFLEPQSRPIANLDLGVTKINEAIIIKSLENDRCVVTNECELDLASVSIITQPSQGGSAIVNNTNGDITYTPAPNYIGKDTLTYQVCVDDDISNCVVAEQIITIFPVGASNSTLAVDDFKSTPQSTPVIGNVLINDTDAEGDDQTVVPQVIDLPQGIFNLQSSGIYSFIPHESFYGPIDFTYTVCDNNSIKACSDAVLHILVLRDVSINVRVYLEGPMLNNNNEVGTTHERPLMRDDLRISPFTSKRYIPDHDPYGPMSARSWVSNEEKYNHVKSGLNLKFTSIADPEIVFGVEGEDAIVDWVFVELRSKVDHTQIISTRSGLLQRDGDVVDLDGQSALRFSGVDVDDYYLVVRHRNHFGAMTAEAKTPTQWNELIDFTKMETGIFDFGKTKFGGAYDYTNLAQNNRVKNGYLTLWGGDLNGNGKVKYFSPGDDLGNLFGQIIGYEIRDIEGNITGYNYFTSYDSAFGYHSGDFDMNSKLKFDNPNDDKNMLYGTLLFYKLNTHFQHNFDFFIEQIPD